MAGDCASLVTSPSCSEFSFCRCELEMVRLLTEVIRTGLTPPGAQQVAGFKGEATGSSREQREV